MKKFAYIAGGIIIGVVVSTTGAAFADTVKSMVGKKVTGEYTIIVDGKTLSDKGAVIDSRANVPARALSEALGADVSVSGKTISITSSEENSVADTSVTSPSTENKYIGQSKSSLEEQKQVIQERILKPTESGKEDLLKEIESLKESEAKGIPVPVLAEKEKQLAEYEADIAEYEAELKLIDEALATAK